jgi:hypothetical protein
MLQIDGEPKEIKPPQSAKPKPASKKDTAPKQPAQAPSDSFPELEVDGEDSFLDELENL